MKIPGVFSFVFGLGLLAFAGYGIYEESRRPTTTGTIAIILLILSGISVLVFVINTFSRTKIYGRVITTDDILDLPDHIAEDERSHSVSPFIIGCGIVSMIAGALAVLYSIIWIYSFAQMLTYAEPDFFRIEFMVMSAFFICSIMLLVYCIRKLFFSRK